jgi:hypothetical protein
MLMKLWCHFFGHSYQLSYKKYKNKIMLLHKCDCGKSYMMYMEGNSKSLWYVLVE